MRNLKNENPFVWVTVVDPGPEETFLGQYDQETKVAFIPVFLEKETALKNYNLMARDKNRTYEIQAIQFDLLAKDAVDNGFLLFVIDEAGGVMEKIVP
jgi:hypothetical protein